MAEAYHLRGQAKASLGDEEGAIRDYDKAIQFNPKFTDAYTSRGLSRYNLDDLQGAYFDFSKALELGPPDADKYLNRGVVKAELGEFVSAIDDYTKAIELDKNDASLYNYRGVPFTTSATLSALLPITIRPLNSTRKIRLNMKTVPWPGQHARILKGRWKITTRPLNWMAMTRNCITCAEW